MQNRLKTILNGIKQRCNNSRHRQYNRYGGRGIKCLLTIEDLEYLWGRDYAENMDRPSVDRINNDGNYVLHNCRIIESRENSVKQAHSSYSYAEQNLRFQGRLYRCPYCGRKSGRYRISFDSFVCVYKDCEERWPRDLSKKYDEYEEHEKDPEEPEFDYRKGSTKEVKRRPLWFP